MLLDQSAKKWTIVEWNKIPFPILANVRKFIKKIQKHPVHLTVLNIILIIYSLFAKHHWFYYPDIITGLISPKTIPWIICWSYIDNIKYSMNFLKYMKVLRYYSFNMEMVTTSAENET